MPSRRKKIVKAAVVPAPEPEKREEQEPEIPVTPPLVRGGVMPSSVPQEAEDLEIDSAPPRRVVVPEWEGEAGVEEPAMPPEPRSGGAKAPRPPAIHISLYRRIATTFAVVTGIILVLVLYLAFAQATVTVVPRKTPVSTEALVIVRPAAAEGEVGGAYEETTLEKTKTLPISGEGRTEDGIASGTVTLVNLSAKDQPLVATTRLLAEGGALFRLKTAVRVPAGGRVDAEVYADAKGASGDIGPSKFTIPGLNQTLQQSIYAVSTAAMTGGVRTVKVVTEADVSGAVAAVEGELAEEAVATLRALAGEAAQGGGEIVAHEVIKRETSAAVGTEASTVEVTVGIRARGVFYDQEKLNELASEHLLAAIGVGQELASTDAGAFETSLERSDAAAQTATVKVIAKGTSTVGEMSDIFDRDKLAGLSAKGVAAYFKQFPEIEAVSVRFRPSWLRRVPNLRDHIDVVIVK